MLTLLVNRFRTFALWHVNDCAVLVAPNNRILDGHREGEAIVEDLTASGVYEMAQGVGTALSACSSVAWALKSLDVNPPVTEVQRMKIVGGITFFWEVTADHLREVYEELSEETGAGNQE